MTRFTGMIVNNSGVDISGIFENAIREANDCELPEEISDIFSVAEIIVDGERRLVVDFI